MNFIILGLKSSPTNRAPTDSISYQKCFSIFLNYIQDQAPKPLFEDMAHHLCGTYQRSAWFEFESFTIDTSV